MNAFSRCIPLLLLLITAACSGNEQNPQHSLVFSRVFNGGETPLRGMEPGMTRAQARAAEKSSPKHQDSLGLVYELNLDKGREGSIEYFTRPGDSVIAGIVVNAFLKNETEARDFYQEAEDHLRLAFGPPVGNYGQVTWGPNEKNHLISLRLHESNRGITLNYSFSSNL